MFIRVADEVFFRGQEGDEYRIKKRKGNVVKKFRYHPGGGGTVQYYHEELAFKMIPKKHIEGANSGTMNALIMKNGVSLFFQEFQDIYFLSMDSQDKIIRLTFEDIEIDTSLLCYDYETDDYFFNEVINKMPIDMSEEVVKGTLIVETDDESVESLSNYVMESEHGVIINDILVL